MKLITNKLEKITLWILPVLFLIMVSALFYQIVTRVLFQSANAWSDEVTRYTFIWMVMLGSSIATRRNRNMDMDFFVNLMPNFMKKINKVLTSLLIISFLIVIIVYGIQLVSITHKQLSAGLQIPMSYIYLAIPVGGILILIYTIESIVDKIIVAKNKEV